MNRRRRMTMLAASSVSALALAAVPSAMANLPGSDFDAGDGNLVLNDEALDWVNAPNLAKAVDITPAADDDSFGQGTKEDTEVPTVVDGSIPPNKSDLTRFYVANNTQNNDEFLYLAWERVQEPSGTTNMDFEFNQSTTLSSNGVTPVRAAGDVLIKYDLAQGGVNPILGYHLWVASGPKSLCEAANATPCWGKVQSLAGNFEGAINTEVVTDPIPPDNPRELSVRTFGEAAINLTDSGLLPADACAGFSSAYLKSRASDSFTAAVKDFIAPIPVSIDRCGAIKVTKTRKHAADGPGDHPHAGVDFTVNGVTKTTDASGVACFDNLAPGSYTVHEVVPAGYNGEADKTVTVDNAAKCSDSPYTGETVSFHNTPLTDLTVSVNSQVTGGTNSKITCSAAPTPADTTPDAFDDTSETAVDLEPGTYTCTVVIDP